MLRDIIEIAFSYVQYFLLLVAIAPGAYPSYFSFPVDALRYLNLDLSELLDEGSRNDNFLSVTVPENVPLDVRLQFIFVSVIVPLLLAVVSLFSLSSKVFFFWFLFFLLGVMFLTVAILSFVIDDPVLSKEFSSSDRNFALYVGLAVVAFAVAIALTYRSIQTAKTKRLEARAEAIRKKRKAERREAGEAVSTSEDDVELEDVEGSDDSEEFSLGNNATRKSPEKKDGEKKKKRRKKKAASARGMLAIGATEPVSPTGQSADDAVVDEFGKGDGRSLEDIMKKETERINPLATFERFIYAGAALFFGLLFVHAFSIDGFFTDDDANSFFFGLGITLLIVGLILLVWFIMGLSERGRVMQFNIATFARDNFVSALLLLVTVLYAPAVSNIVTLFNCSKFTCEAGSAPSDPFSVVIEPLRGSNFACELCNFTMYAQNCPASLQASLCGVQAEVERLRSNPKIDCADLRKYYWPASGIMFVSFVISMPVLNFLLTSKSTDILEEDFPLDDRQIEGYTEEELYYEKVHLSDNVAKFIYDPFQRRFKHWRVLFLFQKLLIVFVSVFTFPSGKINSEGIGTALSLSVHGVCLLYVIYTTPFNRKVENFLMLITQVVLLFLSSCGMASTQGSEPPSTIFLLVAIFAFLFPIGALVIGAVLTFRDNIRKSDERDERIQRAQRAAEIDDGHGGDIAFDQPLDSPSGSPLGGQKGPGFENSPGMGASQSPSHTAMMPPALQLNDEPTPPVGSLNGSTLDVPAFSVLGTVVTKGPVMHSIWFSASKAAMVSPLQRYARLEEIRKTKAKTTKQKVVAQSAIQKTTTGVLLRSPATESLAIPSNSPAMGNAKSPIRPSPRHGFGLFLGKEDQLVAKSPVVPSLGPEEGVGPKKKQSKVSKELWSRVRTALLKKVRDDREEEMRRQEQFADGAGGQSMFSKASAQQKNVNVGAGKYKNAHAMKKWDNLLQDLLKKAREQKAGKEGGDASASPAGDIVLEVPNGASSKKDVAGGSATAAKASENSPDNSPVKDSGAAPSSKRQQLALRAKLKELYDEHLVALQSQQQAVDFKINKETIGAMQLFFVAAGVMAFVALGFCILALLSNTPPASFVQSTGSALRPELVEQMDAYNELGGYPTWSAFTASCCCMGFDNLDPRYPYYAVTVEKWRCQNSRTKERIRAYRWFNATSGQLEVESSVMSVRPLCGMEFSVTGCTVFVNTTTNTLQMSDACASQGVPDSELALW